MTSIIPNIRRRSVCPITFASNAPHTEPSTPNAAITSTAVPNILRFVRCTQIELPEEKRKNKRLMPCTVICGRSVKSARKTTNSPPPPTPIPDRAAIIKEITAVNITLLPPYFIISIIPEYITSAAKSFLSALVFILWSRKPPVTPPSIAGRA